MDKYLYRVSFKNRYSFEKNYPPAYITAENKKIVHEIIDRYINVPKNHDIHKISCLGVQCSGIIFSGSTKNKD